MKKWIFILINCSLLQIGFSQNLIPDGEVELHHNNGCPLPYLAFEKADFWYNSAGTADFYLPNCGYFPGQNSTEVFGEYPYNFGSGFIGAWNIATDSYIYTSEVFGTPLTEPLEAGKRYYFSVDVRYFGRFFPNDIISSFNCKFNPPITLNIYSNTNDTLIQSIENSSGLFAVQADKMLEFPLTEMTNNNLTNQWMTFSGCLIAAGGERHLAFGLNNEPIDFVSNCDSTDFNTVSFVMSYFTFDNFKLQPFPNTIQDTLILCTEKGKVEFNPLDYLNELELDDFEIAWDDGYPTLNRTLSEVGFHQFTLNIGCSKLDFEINVEPIRCEPTTFVPNAFTPNFDGHNDELLPFFSADFPITNYEFMVFDRWGNIFYRSENYDGFTGWDGTVNGKTAPNGVYVWALKFELIAPDGTKHYQLSGDVLLVR